MRRIGLLRVAVLAALAVAGAPALGEKKMNNMSGQKFVAHLTGDQETPDKGDPKGKGTANLAIDSDRGEVCYVFSYEGIGPPDKAHIHRGAKGTAGDIVVNLDPNKSGQC